jgi:hypothetical protein
MHKNETEMKNGPIESYEKSIKQSRYRTGMAQRFPGS